MALPDHLSDLAELFEEWSSEDLSRRVLKIMEAEDDVLKGLADKVLPRADEIDAYLNAFGDNPLDGPARNLVLLAECALEAETEIEHRANPDPVED